MTANPSVRHSACTTQAVVPGGPGWVIDAETLRPRITNREAFRKATANDPARRALEALWTGDAVEAERILTDLLEQNPESLRLRALRADAWRDQGRINAAIREYQLLLDHTRGSALEGTMRQHLGTVLLAAGNLSHALRQFSLALEQRIINGADSSLIDATMQAISRTQELLEMERTHQRGHQGTSQHRPLL